MKRINKYDNLKGFAILLIIFGHLPSMLASGVDNKIVYLIHLPIFFFVAGYFSKTTSDQPLKIFKRLILPYILFSIMWWVFLVYIVQTTYKGILFLNPGFALWFLTVLIIMKFSLYIFDKLKYPILISIIIALISGFINIPPGLLGITRALTYMPLFLTGYCFKKNSLHEKIPDLLKKKHVSWIILVLLLVIGVVVCHLTSPRLMMQIPFEASHRRRPFFRFIVIMIGISFALVFNNLMTDKECFLTKFGKNSMVVYLLHPYFIRYYISPMIMDNFNQGILGLGVEIVIAFIITFILSRDIFTKCYNKIIDLIFNILPQHEKIDKKEV